MTLTDRIQSYIEDHDKTAREVADHFGCHIGFVRKVCQRRGLTTKKDKVGGHVPTRPSIPVDHAWDTMVFESYVERKKRRIKRTLEVRPVTWPIYGRGVGHMSFSILTM